MIPSEISITYDLFSLTRNKILNRGGFYELIKTV